MRVFFSRAASGREMTDSLVSLLRTVGFDVVTDESTSGPEATVAAILSADAVLVVLTPESSSIQFELGLAVGASRPTLLAAASDVDVPAEVAALLFVRLTGDSAGDAARLIAALDRIAEAEGGSQDERAATLPLLALDPARLDRTSPSDFERLVGDYLQSQGWNVQREVATGGAHIDLLLTDTAGRLVAVEMKKVTGQGRVSVDAVRDLAVKMSLAGASEGMLISSAGFTSSALGMAAKTGAMLLTIDDLTRGLARPGQAQGIAGSLAPPESTETSTARHGRPTNASGFPYLLRHVVGLRLDALPLGASPASPWTEPESGLTLGRSAEASKERAFADLTATPDGYATARRGARFDGPVASVLADEDERTINGARNLAAILEQAIGGLPTRADRAVEERGGLDTEWLESFRGWGKAASGEHTRQLLARILAAEIAGEGLYPASFIAKLRALDEKAAKGFSVIAKLVFGPIGVMRVFGDLNQDTTLRRLGLTYQDFIDAEDERLLDRDKETQWQFDPGWTEIGVGEDRYRFRAVGAPGKHPVMRLTPFGKKVWSLMPATIDDEYLRRVIASCAERGIECERVN